MEVYESVFRAPEYTIVDQKTIGKKIITAVIIGSEFVEFEKDAPDKSVNNDN